MRRPEEYGLIQVNLIGVLFALDQIDGARVALKGSYQ